MTLTSTTTESETVVFARVISFEEEVEVLEGELVELVIDVEVVWAISVPVNKIGS